MSRNCARASPLRPDRSARGRMRRASSSLSSRRDGDAWARGGTGAASAAVGCGAPFEQAASPARSVTRTACESSCLLEQREGGRAARSGRARGPWKRGTVFSTLPSEGRWTLAQPRSAEGRDPSPGGRAGETEELAHVLPVAQRNQILVVP